MPILDFSNNHTCAFGCFLVFVLLLVILIRTKPYAEVGALGFKIMLSDDPNGGSLVKKPTPRRRRG